MKRRALVVALTVLLLVTAAACKEKEPPAKTYPLKGVIISREVQSNSLVIQHEEVKGLMEAMTMPFPVKGAKLDELPPNGTRITATLHVGEATFWVTDVKAVSN